MKIDIDVPAWRMQYAYIVVTETAMTKQTPISVRLPEPIRAQVRNAAAEEGRSVNNYICRLIEAAMKSREGEQ